MQRKKSNNLQEEVELLMEENIALCEEVNFLSQQVKEHGETYYYVIPFDMPINYVFSIARG